MNVLEKFQCEHCKTIYNEEHTAQRCEDKHILYGDIQIVRAVHREVYPVTPLEGQWPDIIIVGLANNRDVLSRYKYEGVEEWSDPFFSSDYFNVTT